MIMKTLMQNEKRRRIWLALSVWLLGMTLVVLSQADGKTLGEAFKEVNASVVEIRTVQRSVPHRVGIKPDQYRPYTDSVSIVTDAAGAERPQANRWEDSRDTSGNTRFTRTPTIQPNY